MPKPFLTGQESCQKSPERNEVAQGTARRARGEEYRAMFFASFLAPRKDVARRGETRQWW